MRRQCVPDFELCDIGRHQKRIKPNGSLSWITLSTFRLLSSVGIGESRRNI